MVYLYGFPAIYFSNMTIVEARDNLMTINPVGMVQDIVISDDYLIIEMQKDQMMFGMDATGEDIAPSYETDSYAEMKQQMNSRPEVYTPDLRLTGDFYSGFYLDYDTLTVTSSDDKTSFLIGKYGKSIFGLNEETMKRYRRLFNPKFYEAFRAQLSGEIPNY